MHTEEKESGGKTRETALCVNLGAVSTALLY